MESDTLFMNISSDQIIISDGENDIFLERNDVETILGPKLVQLVDKWNYTKIITLNWPWWFTNLRVGTLCMNILNTVMDNKIVFFDISKIDLYKKAHEFWILPRYWIIYIWQRRNVWVYDFKTCEKVWQYSFDELKEKELSLYDTFTDEVIDENYYPSRLWYTMIKTTFDWNNIYISYWDKVYCASIKDLNLKELKSVSPNYMINPSITIPNK